MAQAGIHALIGIGACRWANARSSFALGIVLGNVLPDMDILAVAVATIAGWPTEELHRTFTHSLFAVALVVVVFYAIGWAVRRPHWKELGVGLGIGILMHIVVDFAIWFRGVAVFWPRLDDVNFWRGVAAPGWWGTFELAAEFLCFALLFVVLHRLASRQRTDQGGLPKLLILAWIQFLLFLALLVVAQTWSGMYRVVFGACYLPSLGLAIGVIIGMRRTLFGDGAIPQRS